MVTNGGNKPTFSSTLTLWSPVTASIVESELFLVLLLDVRRNILSQTRKEIVSYMFERISSEGSNEEEEQQGGRG